jgi:N-acyl-D-aspartate/D-glutamate deacylase
LSLSGRVNPLAPSATFQEVRARHGRDLQGWLAREDIRARILQELTGKADMMARFDPAFELGDPPRYDRSPAESLAVQAAATGTDVKALVYDLLVGGGFVYVPVSNFVEGNLLATREMLVHPHTVPGLSDGGAHCSMIADFDYPTFLLSYWGRDAPEDLRIPIETVVQRQCAATAALVGLNDRGLLQPGKRADINLIDLEKVGSTAPAFADDLPGGGSRLVGAGTGYAATIVAGEMTFENGAHTGALPGRLARAS